MKEFPGASLRVLGVMEQELDGRKKGDFGQDYNVLVVLMHRGCLVASLQRSSND